MLKNELYQIMDEFYGKMGEAMTETDSVVEIYVLVEDWMKAHVQWQVTDSEVSEPDVLSS